MILYTGLSLLSISSRPTSNTKKQKQKNKTGVWKGNKNKVSIGDVESLHREIGSAIRMVEAIYRKSDRYAQKLFDT